MNIEREREPPTHYRAMIAVQAHSAPDQGLKAQDVATMKEQRRAEFLLAIEFVD